MSGILTCIKNLTVCKTQNIFFVQVSIDVEALNNAEAKSKEAAKAAEASAAALAKEVAQEVVEKKPPHKVSFSIQFLSIYNE